MSDTLEKMFSLSTLKIISLLGDWCTETEGEHLSQEMDEANFREKFPQGSI